MATQASMILRRSATQLMQTTYVANFAVPSANFHSSQVRPIFKNEKGLYTCTLIPGDGVGPDLMESAREVLKNLNAPIEFEEFHLSEISPNTSVSLERVSKSLNKNGVALKGVINIPEHGRAGELLSLNQKFRNTLDLYANVVKIESLPGVRARHNNVDLVVVREQTEGEYSALEHESIPGVVECLKVVTAEKSRRIAKFAFDYATRHGRKKVTAIHKANIMKLGDGLFLNCCKEIAQLYPNIKFDQMIVDNASMQMASNPQQFDVMVMPNLYGNIIENLGAGLVGGAGVVSGASYSANLAVFEPGAKHTFDEGVGKNIANPTAILLSTVKMLQHLGLPEHASRLRAAITEVLNSGNTKTRDLGGYATTQQFTTAIINSL